MDPASTTTQVFTSPISTARKPPPANSPAMQRFVRKPHRKSSSRIERWVEDQQKRNSMGEPIETPPESPASDTPSISSGCAPWLVCPTVSILPPTPREQDVHSISGDSFVFVDEQEGIALEAQDVTTGPSATSKKHRLSTAIFSTPTSLRNLSRLSFAKSPRSSLGPQSVTQPPKNPRAPSLFQRNPQSSTSGSRSRNSSRGTLRPTPESGTNPQTLRPSPSRLTLRFKRPSVVGHFSQDSTIQEDVLQLPRPSISSSATPSSATLQTRTSLESSRVYVPQKTTLNTMHHHTPSIFSSSSPSLWSLPADASHMNDPPGSTKLVAQDWNEKSGFVRLPVGLKSSSSNLGTLGSVTSLLQVHNPKKKRKLVIIGLPLNDQRRLERVQKWCESFGEVNSIVRVPNGDLHVDFKRSEVAETVCRLNARVNITGVGSVGLAWYTGKRAYQY